MDSFGAVGVFSLEGVSGAGAAGAGPAMGAGYDAFAGDSDFCRRYYELLFLYGFLEGGTSFSGFISHEYGIRLLIFLQECRI